MLKNLGRTALATAACLVLVPCASVSARPANPRATIAADDWLGEANYLRSFWSSTVPTLTEDSILSANDAKHDHYLDENKTCTHTENPSNAYYSEGGKSAGKNSVIYCSALGPKNDVDGWAGTPLHGEQVLNPRLTVTGFAETSLNGGHAAMDTLTHYADGPAPSAAMTWPNGDGFPLSTYSGGEIDHTGGDAVADNCTSAYAKASRLGAPLFVDLPGNAHDASPTSYALTDTSTGASEPVCVFDAQSTVTPFLSSAVLLPLHPLRRGDSYTGHYTAGGVTGSWSFTVAVTPPADLIEVDLLSNGNREATVGWTAPLDNGGSPVTGYDVEFRAVGTSQWSEPVAAFTHDTATRQTVTGLTNGTRYQLRVAALNAIGRSGFTVSRATAMPGPTAPDVPTGIVGTAGNARVHLTWKAPSNNGGKPITSYQISESAAGHGYHLVSPQAKGTSATVAGLANGTSYRFRVAATSSLGTGGNSAATPAITPQPDLAGRPQLVSAAPAKSSATVTWLRPVSDGGGPITGYDVQYSSDGTTWTSVPRSGTSTSTTITGLVNGTSYRFRVATRNAAGAGPFTATVPAGNVTPGVTVPRGANLDAYLRHPSTRYGDGGAVTCEAAEVKEPAPGVPVAVLTRPAGSDAPWQASAVKRTGSRGQASFTLDPAHNSSVRCRALGTDQHIAATSSVYRLDVAPSVAFHLSKRTVRHGSTVTITGRLSPAAAGSVVVQDRKNEHWRALGSPTELRSDGTYRTTLTVSGRGHLDLRAHRAATSTNLAGDSPVVRLTIT